MLSPNTYLQNRYRIIRILGRGGMGHVYEAIDDAVECIVAIKETVANSDQLRKAFEREAKLLANLRHSVLPRVTHYFFEGNHQFLVMDFIEGLNLAELLSLRKIPLTYEEVLPWTDELLKGLEYLHNRSEPIIHRDIKPANIKLTKDGQIYLLDFGLAKGTAGQMSVDQTGQLNVSVYGYTEAYASPEQINNAGTNERSDLYSLGATLYHLLTAQIPASAPRRELKVALGKPDPLLPIHEVNAAIPEPLSLVVSRAMALNQEDRIASASEMRRALEEAKRAIEAGRAEQMLETRGGSELAWQETQPPEPLLKSPPAMSGSMTRSARPAEKKGDSSRAELPTLNTPLPPALDNPSPIAPVISGAEVSWPSQIDSETEDSQAVLPATETGDLEDQAAIAERAAEESRRQEAQAAERERQRLEAEAQRRAEEERLRQEAEEAQRRQRVEAEERERVERERLRAEEEARHRQAEEEAAARRRAEEDAARRRAAELAEEQARQREMEERQRAAALRLAREEEQRREQEELRRRQAEEEQRREQESRQQESITARQTSIDASPGTSAELPVETNVSDLRETIRLEPTISSRLEHLVPAADAVAVPGLSQTPATTPTVERRRRSRPWLIVASLFVLVITGIVIFAVYSSRQREIISPPGEDLSRVNISKPNTWSYAKTSPVSWKQDLKGQRGVAWSVAFSPDGRILASASEDGKVRLWETQSWEPLRTLDGHEAGVNSVAFSPNGRTIASGSNDKTVRLWDAQRAAEPKILKGHADEVYFVAFSPDSKQMASAGKDKAIRLWDVQTGKELKSLKGHADIVWSVAFSPDGKQLASASKDKTIKLWDVESGKEIRTLSGHTRAVIAIAFAHDGKQLASGSDDRLVKLWDAETWQESRTLTGHSSYITSIAFAPDDKTLACAGNDKTVQLWDTQTGESKQILTGHTKGVNAVSFSPDGQTLISGSKDETVKMWQ